MIDGKRIKIEFEPLTTISYNYPNSLKKTVLGILWRNTLYRNLHDSPIQKLISVSYIHSDDRIKFQKSGIDFGKKAYFYVSSPVPEFINHIEKFLTKKRKVFIEEKHPLINIEEVNPPEINPNCNKFKLKTTPVHAQVADSTRKEYIPLQPNHPYYTTLLINNLERKISLITGKPFNLKDKITFTYRPGKNGNYKVKTFTFKSSSNKEYIVRAFILNNLKIVFKNTTPEEKRLILETLYYSGIGAKNSHGFGFVYSIKGEEK